MLIGYARVSTTDQNLDMQRDELKRGGCKRIFTDVASGSKSERPGLNQAVAFAREGDTIVVWKLDRFGRSLTHLIEGVRQLQARSIGFRSLRENIDTTTPTGKLIFHIFGALAEFERDLIRERTIAGLAAARARGRKGGRRHVLDAGRLALLRSMASDRDNPPAVICATMGISRATFYRYLDPRTAPQLAEPPTAKRKRSRAAVVAPEAPRVVARAPSGRRTSQAARAGARRVGPTRSRGKAR